MKSGNLNFLESPGPLQACKGTALLFYIAEEGNWRFSETICYILGFQTLQHGENPVSK